MPYGVSDRDYLQNNLSSSDITALVYTDSSLHIDFMSRASKTFTVNERHTGDWDNLKISSDVPSLIPANYDEITNDYYSFDITNNNHTVVFDHSANLGNDSGTIKYYFERSNNEVTPEYDVDVCINDFVTTDSSFNSMVEVDKIIGFYYTGETTFTQPELLYDIPMNKDYAVIIDEYSWIRYPHTYSSGKLLESIGDYFIEFDISSNGNGDEHDKHDLPTAIGQINSLVDSYDSNLSTPIYYNISGAPHIMRNGTTLEPSGSGISSIEWFQDLEFNFPLIRSKATVAIHFKDTLTSAQRYMLNFNVLPLDISGCFSTYVDIQHPYLIVRDIPDINPILNLPARDGTTFTIDPNALVKRVEPFPVTGFQVTESVASEVQYAEDTHNYINLDVSKNIM